MRRVVPGARVWRVQGHGVVVACLAIDGHSSRTRPHGKDSSTLALGQGEVQRGLTMGWMARIRDHRL